MPPDEENPEEILANETEQLEQNGATGAEPAAEVPENYSGLMDAARELEPRLKNSDTLPPGPTGPEGTERGPDGKFLPKKGALAADASGAVEVSGASGPEAATGATGPTGVASRDSDLEVKPDPQIRPSTRKIIEGHQQKAIEARNQRDTIHAEREQLKLQLTEAQEKLKTIKAPKEMEDELATLRSRVRELDISKDPALQQKYDSRIKKNGESALGLLKDFGIFSVAQKEGPPKEMTEAEKKSLTADLEKSGFGIRGMAKYISNLERAGEYEAAERLRQAASETDRLAQEKEAEIAKWSADYEGLQATRTREAQAQQEAYTNSIKSAAETTLKQDLDALTKQFPFIARPAPVLPTDTPEQAAVKQKAIEEHAGHEKAIQEAIKNFSGEGLPPEKAALAFGKMQAAAIQTVAIKQVILPRMIREAEASTARIKDLETELGKIRKAGTINRAHSAAITNPTDKGKAPDKNLSLEEAARQIALENGMKID